MGELRVVEDEMAPFTADDVAHLRTTIIENANRPNRVMAAIYAGKVKGGSWMVQAAAAKASAGIPVTEHEFDLLREWVEKEPPDPRLIYPRDRPYLRPVPGGIIAPRIIIRARPEATPPAPAG